MGVSAEEERLSLNTLIAKSVESRRRELVFNSDIASLVTGDFTIDSIEYQALQLLRKVTIFQEPCDSVRTRPAPHNNRYLSSGYLVNARISWRGEL